VNLTPNDVDTIVNIFTLVQTLCLTISVALTVVFCNGSTYEYMETVLLQCSDYNYNTNDSYINHFLQHFIFIPVWNLIFASGVCEVLGIVGAIYYFVLRPRSKKKFASWWPRGRFGVLILVSLISIGTQCLVITFLFLLYWIVLPPQMLCQQYELVSKNGPYALLELMKCSSIIVGIISAITIFLFAFLFI